MKRRLIKHESLESRQLLAGDYPSVVSLEAQQSYAIGNDDVAYVVTFDEAVSGVDPSDFVLNTTGITGASIASVTPQTGSTSFDVVVSTGTGDGTLQLQLVDDDSIIN